VRVEIGTLEFGVADGIATLRLNRPEALNALSMQSLVELRAAEKRPPVFRHRCHVPDHSECP
jgi:hypothetical protein